jgi:tRNA dimethylallyltransferase
MRLQQRKERDFQVVKIALNLPRHELVNRIELRVNKMIGSGLEDEVISLLPYRNLNSLNTLGYKEMLEYIDGKSSLALAVERIKTNTRRYAKRQLTWFRKDQDYQWFEPGQMNEIVEYVKTFSGKP